MSSGAVAYAVETSVSSLGVRVSYKYSYNSGSFFFFFLFFFLGGSLSFSCSGVPQLQQNNQGMTMVAQQKKYEIMNGVFV